MKIKDMLAFKNAFASSSGGGDKVEIGDPIFRLPLEDGGRWIATGIDLTKYDNLLFYELDNDNNLTAFAVCSQIKSASYNTLYNTGVAFNVQQVGDTFSVSYANAGSGKVTYIAPSNLRDLIHKSLM